MTIKSLMLSASVVGLLAISSSAFAHHGNVAYDNTKLVELKQAVVTKVLWGNPHTLVLFDVKDDKGDVKHWTVEGDAASAVSSQGWTKNAVQPGDVITVYLYQARNGALVGRTGKLVLADGKAFGSGNLFDQERQCDKDFGPGGSGSAACRPDGRKTQTSDVPISK
jgi:hypothetical protein